MPLTPLKQTQIEPILSKLEKEEEIMTRVLMTAGMRIVELRENKYFLETTFLNSAVIEKLIKLVLEAYKARRRILNFIGEKDIYADVDLKTSNQTLGGLIKTLSEIKINEKLIKRLNIFCNLRNEATHHLFDGTKELREFDKEAETYFVSEDCNNLYNELLEEHKQVKKDIENIIILLKHQK